MVIEFKVPFNCRKDAVKFQQYLKKHDCSSQLEETLDISEKIEYSATVECFEDFFNECEWGDQGNEYWENEKADIDCGREWLADFKKGILQFYSRFEAGVVYSFEEDILKGMCGFNPEILEVGPENLTDEEAAKRFEMVSELTYTTSILLALKENHCLTEDLDAGTFTLMEKKPVESLTVVSRGEDIFGGFHPHILTESGITLMLIGGADTGYSVTLGPEFILLNIDNLIYQIAKTEPDEESLKILARRMKSHVLLADRVYGVIREGASTPTEIQLRMSEPVDNSWVVYHISDTALKDILKDFEKIGMIERKKGVIKLAEEYV